MKLFEMFAGYGGASFSLKQLGVNFECVGYSEIDKYAIQCYNQNHYSMNYGDCKKINPSKLPDFDLLTGGFPCQSFSIAGQMRGELDARGTLFYDIIRIAEIKKPRYMLLENVKGLTFKKNKDIFDKILSELRRIGYVVFWDVLNSKNYGIPQNRERIFIVCFRNIEDAKKFSWPCQRNSNFVLRDLLERDVEDKYFLDSVHMNKLIEKSGIKIDLLKSAILPCLTPKRLNKRQLGRRFKKDDEVSFTVNTQDRHGVLIIDDTQGFDGVRVYKDIVPTIRSSRHGLKVIDNLKLRILTPKECFRLMGFLQDQIDIHVLSDAQQYKLAGNGWDINLVSLIFDAMFGGKT